MQNQIALTDIEMLPVVLAAAPVTPAVYIHDAVEAAWKRMAPFWPLKNLIAVNPLQGFEDLPFETALAEGAHYFQQTELPEPMLAINRETIKWCQAFLDDGQATLPMPGRHMGLWAAWCKLAPYDDRLTGGTKQKQAWLGSLPNEPFNGIAACLAKLNIKASEQADFLTLLLTTLPGWAAHLKYRTEWTGAEPTHANPVSKEEYLAMRLAITCMMWPEAQGLVDWHKAAKLADFGTDSILAKIEKNEVGYRKPLLKALATQQSKATKAQASADAQWVFCIDVRSEPFRRALEATGHHQTLGFAGFFGLPIRVQDPITGESYASCPVLLAPQHDVAEHCCSGPEAISAKEGFRRVSAIKKVYQSVKFTFTAPFALVETMGLPLGIWMGLRSLLPSLASRLQTQTQDLLAPKTEVVPDLANITLEQQAAYAQGALRMMGLTSGFAPWVVLCGHGSSTQNNAFATALDCGACGGQHGASNARALVTMLNAPAVRELLAEKGIHIPTQTQFIAGEHNTTTDAVELYEAKVSTTQGLAELKKDLEQARLANSQVRALTMGVNTSKTEAGAHVGLRSADWAQVRPEWGLARNAAFVVAPRTLTADINLEGRSFLHSYDWQQDSTGSSLTVILTAPMVVAHWINSQYLFSTLDNTAYGGGSKVTNNITGKIGIMQGNASDLMHGLPLQSVYATDSMAYHEPQRLMTVVYAPRTLVSGIVEQQAVLQKLFGNGWVTLACIDPTDEKTYILSRSYTWEIAS